MYVRLMAAAIAILAWSGGASAQFGMPGYGGYGGFGGGYGGYGGGGGGYGGFMPNIYNQQTQPLSPYLNMFRGGGNPAANYYFGVRPGTVGGYGRGYGGAPNIAMGGNRMPFFPELANAAEPLSLPEAEPGTGTVLPPAGHPVVFANTMGYFPYPFGMYGRGMNRMGMGGMGGYGGMSGASGMSGSRTGQSSSPRR